MERLQVFHKNKEIQSVTSVFQAVQSGNSRQVNYSETVKMKQNVLLDLPF